MFEYIFGWDMMQQLYQLERDLNSIILGKRDTIRLVLVCLIAKGHLLLEDLPGSGKTTLAKALAKLTGLSNNRVQFTADMLPSDITGAMIYNHSTQKFRIQRGAVFTNILLADEINRASPKCQSALLEAMEEGQVSIEGNTLILDNPFFVVATQNPTEQYGTYPLPESQLDRFLFRLSLGYMDSASEIEVISGKKRSNALEEISPKITIDEIKHHQNESANIVVSLEVAKYVQALLYSSRNNNDFIHGLSTRAGIALIRSGQAFAYLSNDKYLYPEHIQAIFPAVATHRLIPKSGDNREVRDRLVKSLLEKTAIDL